MNALLGTLISDDTDIKKMSVCNVKKTKISDDS